MSRTVERAASRVLRDMSDGYSESLEMMDAEDRGDHFVPVEVKIGVVGRVGPRLREPVGHRGHQGSGDLLVW
jgi:hypothetical protein